MSRRRWFLLAAVLAVLAGLRWVDLHPIRLPVEKPRVGGAPVLRTGDGAVALLLHPPERPPDGFSAGSWAYAWWNALEQEFGPVDVIDLEAPPPALPPWEGAILAGTVDEAWSSRLQDWVAAGGRLLVDGCGPTPEWLDAATGEPLAWTDVADPAAVAFLEEVAPAAPLLLRSAHGRGAVTRLQVCAGRLLQSLQQGRPQEDFSVRERGGAAGLRTPVDLAVLPPELADLPVTDLLERRLLDLAFGGRPLLGLWPVPDGRPGAYLPSHDEEGYGDPTLFQADHERAEDARSTFFIIPGAMTPEALSSLCADGFDVGLHWDRGYPGPVRERLGIGRFRPFWRERTLEDQLEQLRGLLPAGCGIRGNRNHGLLWSADYAGVLERLAANGLSYDATYGPDGDRYGYVFGTALPFRPLDARGLPLPLLEIPFHFQDDERFERDFLRRFLTGAAERYHGGVGLLAHPTTMGYRPSVDRFDAWMESYRLARELDLWTGTQAALASFWVRRGDSTIRPGRDGRSWSVTAEGEDLWIWVRPGGTRVAVDGRLQEPGRRLRPAGLEGEVTLYRIGPGSHQVELR